LPLADKLWTKISFLNKNFKPSLTPVGYWSWWHLVTNSPPQKFSNAAQPAISETAGVLVYSYYKNTLYDDH